MTKKSSSTKPTATKAKPGNAMAKKSSPTKPTAKKAKSGNAKGKKGSLTNAQKILNAIASQHALGKEKADKKTVQGLSGIVDKKTFDTVCGSMKNKAGLVLYDKDSIELTEAGRGKVDPADLEVATTNDAFHARIKEQLKNKPTREIFDILADGRWYSKDEIARKMGLENNKSFGTYLSGLSKSTEKKDGKYRLKDDVFPVGGRPRDA